MNRTRRWEPGMAWSLPASRLEFTEAERRAHLRRSLKMTLMTFALGAVMFALFFALVAACERL